MGLTNIFKLAKLTIEAYTDKERGDFIDSLEVPYNPETLSTRHESVFQGRLGIPTQAYSRRWLHQQAPELSVRLVFDGTDVDHFGVEQLGDLKSVSDRVAKFLKLCYTVTPETHQANFLRLTWGTVGVLNPGGLEGFDCRLLSVDIQYTLFDRDAAPLRAELNCRFVEAIDPAKKKAQLRLSSPDLTHRRVVRNGDTLPALCREIYGSATHYVRVAEANGLDGLRDLTPGQELFFPPFARREPR